MAVGFKKDKNGDTQELRRPVGEILKQNTRERRKV